MDLRESSNVGHFPDLIFDIFGHESDCDDLSAVLSSSCFLNLGLRY